MHVNTMVSNEFIYEIDKSLSYVWYVNNVKKRTVNLTWTRVVWMNFLYETQYPLHDSDLSNIIDL